MKTTAIDHSGMKLGKGAPRHDPRTLMLADYLDADTLPATPPKYAYGQNIAATAWGMMDNDKIGDCTCAAAGHLIMEWTDDNGNMYTPPDADIIAAYAAITGYNPQTGQNDNGAQETDVLNYWRNTGISNHKIFAYAALEPNNHNHVMISTFLFGGCYIGLSLPVTAQKQNVWSVPPGGARGQGAPGSWGGHAVCVVGYDSHGLTVITWGATKRMTWSFWDAYCDEAYAIISTDFASQQTSPSGFDFAALQQDLQQVTS